MTLSKSHVWMPAFGNSNGSASDSDPYSYSSLMGRGYNVCPLGVDVLSDSSSVCFASLQETMQ